MTPAWNRQLAFDRESSFGWLLRVRPLNVPLQPRGAQFRAGADGCKRLLGVVAEHFASKSRVEQSRHHIVRNMDLAGAFGVAAQPILVEGQ